MLLLLSVTAEDPNMKLAPGRQAEYYNLLVLASL